MDVPAAIKVGNEEIVLPLLSTTDLLPVYAKLKTRRLEALKESLKELGGDIDPIQKVEMLRREKTIFYNINLIVDYVATPEGMDEIVTMSLRKKGIKDDTEIARILALPVAVETKQALAERLLNPTESGELERDKPGAGAPGSKPADDPTKNLKVFGGDDAAEEAVNAAAESGNNGPP